MSEAKFTKGNWKAETCDFSGIKTAIVYLDNKGGFDLSGAPDCIANAHLIKTAPKMYEMLTQISDILDGQGATYAVERIESLLAEARGE